jgi:hypothetical protein
MISLSMVLAAMPTFNTDQITMKEPKRRHVDYGTGSWIACQRADTD